VHFTLKSEHLWVALLIGPPSFAAGRPFHPDINCRFPKIAGFSILIFWVLISNLCRADPAVMALLPANRSANVCADTPLRLTFNEPVVLGGTGRIVVYRAADNQPVDAFDLSDAAFTNNFGGKILRCDPIQIEGNAVSVELHSHALHPAENYYVKIGPGVFKSASGQEFTGLTNDSAWKFSTRAVLPRGRTRLIVAADGTGDFCTPQGAVDYVPDDNQATVEIFIRKGVYNGMVYIAPDKSRIHFIGEDRHGTVIAGRNNDRLNSGRLGRALVSVDADDFVLENMTLHNTTPYGGSQAEALRVNSDRCVLRYDDFRSFQDTLLLSGRVYATNCYVEGDVDFIWGQGGVFFDQCEIKAVHNGYYLQARNAAERPGYVFFQCKLTAAPGVARCLLARIDADRFPCSQAAFINCQMGAQVPPVGWEAKGTNVSRLRFEEFHSTDTQGNPVDVSQRHPASRQLTASEADELSDPAKVLSDQRPWNPRNTSAAVMESKP
jgi:pectin methylesterase-like acyl-CoA thioesterase